MPLDNLTANEIMALEENRQNELWEAINENMSRMEEYNHTARAIRARIKKIDDIIVCGRIRIKNSEKKCALIRKILDLPDNCSNIHEEIERIKNCLKRLNLENPEERKKLKTVIPIVRSLLPSNQEIDIEDITNGLMSE